MKKSFLIIFGLIIIFRIFLISLPSFKIDMVDWQAWASRLLTVGPSNFYNVNFFTDYLPGYLYILLLKASFFKLVFPKLSLFSLEFDHFIKFINTVFDMATAFYIYKIITRYNRKWAYIGSLIYLSNPASIFNTSVWGQVDSLVSLLVIYSSYQLIELKKFSSWSITTALGFLVKPQSLVILPILFFKYLKEPKRYYFFIFLFLILPIALIISLPFFIKDPLFGLLHLLIKSSNQYPYTSVNAFNLWSFVGMWISDLIGYPSYYILGIIFYGISILMIGLPFIRLNPKNSTVYFALALSILAFFLFPTRIHERYLLPFFAFFAITVCIYRSLKLLIIYLVLSLIQLANLWYVYFYYNYVYGGNIHIPWLFQTLQSNYNLLSITALILFAYLVVNFYQSIENEEIKN